jgi:hypothetical protein
MEQYHPGYFTQTRGSRRLPVFAIRRKIGCTLTVEIKQPLVHSIRVNSQWRLVFRWRGSRGEAEGVYLDDHSCR